MISRIVIPSCSHTHSSLRSGLNRWPLPYQGSALPTELRKRSDFFERVAFHMHRSEHFQFWAGDGTRTRDQQLGRLWLYQLSYSRMHSIPSYVKNFVHSTWTYFFRPAICGQGRIRTFEGMSRQIYSLMRLTASLPARELCARLRLKFSNRHRTTSFSWAGYRTRTDDLLITNQLLYQLSYASKLILKAKTIPPAIFQNFNRSISWIPVILVIRTVRLIAEL